MHACLFVILLALTLASVPTQGAAQADPMDFEAAAEINRGSQQTQTDQRRARAGVAGSSIGVAVGLVGIVMGGVLLAQSRNGCSLRSDFCQATLMGPDASRRTGTALLVVSPLVVGASVFGLVRSRRRLNQDKDREPASWR